MHRFDGEQRLKGASWIWEDNTSPDRWLLLRKKFSLDAVPEAAEAYIAAETKYYLYINGRLAVFEGGLNRGPAPGCGYYDAVDIAPFLQKGENIIAAEVWYWGNEGRNNIDCGHGGFIFACPETGVYSDSSWRMLANPAQVPVSDPYTEILYGGHDIGYDARRAPGDWKSAGYDEKQFAPACELGAAGDAPWGPLARRCVPLWRFSGIRQYTGIKKHYNTYTCALPHGMQVTPYLKISASGGELIDIRTDRYIIRGGPFFTQYKYKVQRCEYTAAEGRQEFEVLNWMYGENVIYTIPEGVEVIELGYRESGYDCDVINGFTSSDRDMNILAEKSAVTLYSCIRDNFMDCPDRERGQWIGDLAVQMPQVFYTLDRRADQLCLKAIWDIINFRRGDIIVGVVPGVHFSELPGQILPAVSEIGVVAEYYNYTGDQSVLEAIHQPLVKYLKLWDFDFNSGEIVTRLCDWYWLDHGDEIDSKILENCWYYSALRFCRKICGIIGAQADEELKLRERSIRDNFVKNYLRDDGFRSGDILDDRANAMALLCGFVPQEAMDTVLSVFDSEYRCTPFTEYYLLAALFENGYADRAMKRMRMRYDGMIHNCYSTLWEDFTVTGTYNHAWSGGPLVLLNKYGCGLRPLEPGYKTIGVLPQDIGVRNLQTGVETAQGKVEVQINIDKYFFQVTVIAPEQPVVIGIPADWFGQKEPRLYLNGEAAAFEKNGLHYTVCTGGGFNELMGRK